MTTWLLALLSISTIILLVFSSDFEVILLIPVIPSILSSILRVIICSISRGEAPGKTASIIIILADLSGKNVYSNYITDFTRKEYHFDFPKGLYLVNFLSKSASKTMKIIMQ